MHQGSQAVRTAPAGPPLDPFLAREGPLRPPLALDLIGPQRHQLEPLIGSLANHPDKERAAVELLGQRIPVPLDRIVVPQRAHPPAVLWREVVRLLARLSQRWGEVLGLIAGLLGRRAGGGGGGGSGEQLPSRVVFGQEECRRDQRRGRGRGRVVDDVVGPRRDGGEDHRGVRVQAQQFCVAPRRGCMPHKGFLEARRAWQCPSEAVCERVHGRFDVRLVLFRWWCRCWEIRQTTGLGNRARVG